MRERGLRGRGVEGMEKASTLAAMSIALGNSARCLGWYANQVLTGVHSCRCRACINPHALHDSTVAPAVASLHAKPRIQGTCGIDVALALGACMSPHAVHTPSATVCAASSRKKSAIAHPYGPTGVPSAADTASSPSPHDQRSQPQRPPP